MKRPHVYLIYELFNGNFRYIIVLIVLIMDLTDYEILLLPTFIFRQGGDGMEQAICPPRNKENSAPNLLSQEIKVKP